MQLLWERVSLALTWHLESSLCHQLCWRAQKGIGEWSLAVKRLSVQSKHKLVRPGSPYSPAFHFPQSWRLNSKPPPSTHAPYWWIEEILAWGECLPGYFGSSSCIHPHPRVLGWFAMERVWGNLLFQVFPLLPCLCQVRRKMGHQPHGNTTVPPYFSTCPCGRELDDPHQGHSMGVGVPLKGYSLKRLISEYHSPRGQFHILQKISERMCQQNQHCMSRQRIDISIISQHPIC